MPEFTSTAVGVGGRRGRVRSGSGSYDHQVTMPGAPAAGVTPEELVAGAWASCYGSALAAVARSHGVDAANAEITAEVTLNATEDHQYDVSRAVLTVQLDADEDTVRRILAQADEACPISKLLRRGAGDVRVVHGTAS